MRSRKLVQLSALPLVRQYNPNGVGVAYLVLSAILFSLTVYYVFVYGYEDGAWELACETQACNPIVFLQPDDEEEEDDEAPAPDLFANWNTTESKVLGARRFILKQEFQIELDRVSSVCGLEPKQIKKLQIASKGGVKKAMKEWRKTILTRFGMINRNGVNEDEDRETVEEEVYSDVSDIDRQTRQLASNAYTNSVKSETTANNSFWKKTLKSTLSKEQKEVWGSFVTEQREAKRERMADAAIEKLNFEFGLTPQQKEEFVELVRPEMLKAKLETVENVGRHYESYLYLYYASKTKNSKMKKLLTKAQMHKWNLVVSTAKQYGSMLERDNQVVRRNANVWERQGFGLATLVEGAAEMIEEVVEFAGSVFNNRR